MNEVINDHLLPFPKGSLVNILDYNLRGVVKNIYLKINNQGKKYFEYLVQFKNLDNNAFCYSNVSLKINQMSLVSKDLPDAYKCKKCGGYISKKYLDYNENYIDMCEMCVSKLYKRTTAGTGTAKRYPLNMLFGKNNIYYLLSEKNQYKFCEACDMFYKGYHECQNRNFVQLYHTINPLKFYKESNEVNPRYFGIEHETNKRSDFNSDFECDECCYLDEDGERTRDCEDCEELINPLNRIASDIMREFPQLYIQHDGSVNGFEVISQPLTLKMWFKFNVKKYLGMLEGLTASEGTGFHVHVNKESVNKLTIYKINEFFRINSNLVYRLFERTSDEQSWCRITNKETNKILYSQKYQSGEKYQILNTGKESTIEFRGFRSTMTAYKFMARIEFCDFIINYFDKTANYNFEQFYNAGLNSKYPNLRRYFQTMQTKVF